MEAERFQEIKDPADPPETVCGYPLQELVLFARACRQRDSRRDGNFKEDKMDKKEEAQTLPTRRERSFAISATLTKQSDSNTESRMVLILRTESGRESKLYKQE